MSYTIPESPTVELSDISYDGKRQDNLLTDGLGRLIDGEVGADNYRLDMGDGRGNRWVDTRRVPKPDVCLEDTPSGPAEILDATRASFTAHRLSLSSPIRPTRSPSASEYPLLSG